MEEARKQQRRKRRSSYPSEVWARIDELSAGRPDESASVIRQQLLKEAVHPRASFSAGDIPSVRTIHDRLRTRRPHAPSEAWSMATTTDEDAPLVLPVWQDVVERTGGRVTSLRSDEAHYIAKIRRAIGDAYPDGPSFWDIYMLAREYVVCNEQGESAAGADMYLAFAPWRSTNAFRYGDAVHDGRIPPRLFQTPAELGNEITKTEEQDTDEQAG